MWGPNIRLSRGLPETALGTGRVKTIRLLVPFSSFVVVVVVSFFSFNREERALGPSSNIKPAWTTSPKAAPEPKSEEPEDGCLQRTFPPTDLEC